MKYIKVKYGQLAKLAGTWSVNACENIKIRIPIEDQTRRYTSSASDHLRSHEKQKPVSMAAKVHSVLRYRE